MYRYLLAALVIVGGLGTICSATKPWKVTKPKPKPKPVGLCYDCDYDPDDAQVRQVEPGEKFHWNGYITTPAAAGHSESINGRRGFPRCALDSGDELFVRVTECHSNVCFIRRDHNGLVYRGCADSRNLPLGVDSSVQCREQGKPTAVWWFCNDTLCNSDQFNTVCSADSSNSNSGLSCDPHASKASGRGYQSAGYPPSMTSGSIQPQQPAGYGTPQVYQRQSDNGATPERPYPPHQPAPSTSDDSSSSDTPWSDSAGQSAEPSYGTWDFLLLAKSRLQLQDPYTSDEEDQLPTTGYVDEKTNADDDETNPCDHKCVDNPSALFVDPSRPSGFIQCGPGVDHYAGVVCHCCIPYRLTCPYGAHFDTVAKTCTNGRNFVVSNGNKTAAQGGKKPGVYEYVH